MLRRQFFNKKKKKTGRGQKGSGFDYNLVASIGKIKGGGGAFIRDARIDLKKRSGKLVWLNLHGKSNNSQASVAMRIEQAANGKRVLKAESADAGSTFRMIGLYPNVRGGRLSLLVDMDPKGRTEKNGTLWVKNFHVISSQTIDSKMKSSEIFSNDFLGSSPHTIPPCKKGQNAGYCAPQCSLISSKRRFLMGMGNSFCMILTSMVQLSGRPYVAKLIFGRNV